MKRFIVYLAALLLLASITACATQKMSARDSQRSPYKYDDGKQQSEVEQSKDSKTGERINYMLGGKNLEDCIKMKGWHACQ
jgi:predicted small lipoprotein YifL